METTDYKLIMGRRKALKMLGFSSAAIFSGVIGGVSFGRSIPEMDEMLQESLAPSTKSRVSFTNGTDRKTMMKEILQPFEPQIREGLIGKQLVIKPNMVVTNTPLCATHPDAIRGVLDFIKPFYKGQIIIAESCAGGDAMEGYKTYGILDLQNEYDIKFVDLNQSSGTPFWVMNPDLRPAQTLIGDIFLDPKNYIISISRLKTHDTTVMTAGTKNIVMAAPLNIPAVNGGPVIRSKRIMHSGGPRWLNFNMFLLSQQIRPDLTVIDGLEGMEGNGPVRGTSVDHRIALAGDDVFAVDSICTKLMGIPIENVGYLNYGAASGLGNIDYNKIEILGNKNPDNHIIKYKLHDTSGLQLDWKNPLNVQKGV